jgi:hypothetical protein
MIKILLLKKLNKIQSKTCLFQILYLKAILQLQLKMYNKQSLQIKVLQELDSKNKIKRNQLFHHFHLKNKHL